jgi:nucleoside-diphosphate-sugar epimerase|tara:strand:+ start:2860 stop:3756 length:897 start_codon:yes stop_codon:yes gene_type:complete
MDYSDSMNDVKANKKLLLVGCGDIATQLGHRMLAHGYTVTAIRRNIALLPVEFEGMSADVTKPETLSTLAKIDFDAVVITLTPSARSEEGYMQSYYQGTKNILAALQHNSNTLLLFASSTSVYHQADGNWVDETSPTNPEGYSGQVMLKTEKLLADSKNSSINVRFGGIYRTGQEVFLNQVRAGAVAPSQEYYSNRIHSNDCAGVLEHLIMCYEKGQSLAECYMAVDCEPAPLAEVVAWLRDQLADGAIKDGDELKRRAGSKRCSNRRLLELGYKFKYPSYREGYRVIIDSAQTPIKK